MIWRILRAGIAGAIAWWAGLMLVFGAAQQVLADPALQSAKMMAVYDMPPPPRIAVDPWLLPVGILIIALIHASVFAYLRPAFPAGFIKRGVAFGLVAWALLVPWFEFYLPWSLLLEPGSLVLIEMLCWAVIMLMVGMAISAAFGSAGPHREEGPVRS
jgi:hypothetical protein